MTPDERTPDAVSAAPGDSVECAVTWYVSTGTRMEIVDGRPHLVESLVNVHLLRAAAGEDR